MTTQYTTILKLALPVQGELSGTWGDVVNDNITQMVEQAVAGKAVINTWTGNSHTLTTADGTTSESRCAILELTDSGTALTGAGTVVCPTNTKLYIVDNNTAEIITVQTAAGTGVAVPVGKTMLVYCDGTNVVEGVTHANSLSLGTSTVTADKILDEDNMASDSATAIATQQSIKAYVDSQVGTVDTLAEILANGNTTGANDIDVDSAQKVQFRDAAIYINSSVDGQLDIVADTEIQIAATTVDLNGNLDVSGTALVTGVLTTTAATVFNGGFASNADSTLGTDKKVQFRDSAIYINSSADGQLDIVADTEIQIAATTIDANGNLDVSGTIAAGGVVTVIDGSTSAPSITNAGDANTGIYFPADDNFGVVVGGSRKILVNSSGVTINNGVLDADGGITVDNITIDGTTIALSSGDLTLDVAGNIKLDADDNGEIRYLDGGTQYAAIKKDGDNALFQSIVADGDFVIQGIDGASFVSALTLDMSEAGAATFNSSITIPDWVYHSGDSNTYFGFPSGDEFKVVTANIGRLHIKGSESVWNEGGENVDFRVESDSQSHMLFVDAVNNRIGIQTSAPDAEVHISGTSPHIDLGPQGGNRAKLGYASTNLYLGTTSGGGEVIIKNNISSAGAPESSGDEIARFGDTIVFNEGSRDQDFRVESDTNANALFVQGSDGNVGIGLTPTEHLHVGGRANAVLELQSSTTTGTGRVNFNDGANSGQILYSHTANTMDFYSGGSYAMRLTSTGITAPQGIYLGGTGAANLLDDYEEGTWTPEIYYQNATDQGNATDVTQTGLYTKIGRVVTLNFRLIWNITGSPAADNIGVKNLPFTGTGDTFSSAGTAFPINNNTTINTLLLGKPSSGGSLTICESGDMVGNLGNQFGSGNNKEIRGTLTYFTSQ